MTFGFPTWQVSWTSLWVCRLSECVSVLCRTSISLSLPSWSRTTQCCVYSKGTRTCNHRLFLYHAHQRTSWCLIVLVIQLSVFYRQWKVPESCGILHLYLFPESDLNSGKTWNCVFLKSWKFRTGKRWYNVCENAVFDRSHDGVLPCRRYVASACGHWPFSRLTGSTRSLNGVPASAG